MAKLSWNLLMQLAAEQGLEAAGWVRPDYLPVADARLQTWLDQGSDADLSFLRRNRENLAHPERLLPAAKSAVVFWCSFAPLELPKLELGWGRVSRYAWGRDYHEVIPPRIKALVSRVEQVVGRRLQYRIFTDAVPLLERALAVSAGLGFVGRNGMLIRPGWGSGGFLAELFWDLEISPPADFAGSTGCGSCTACRSSCPTGALVEDYQLAVGWCRSYLNIEKRGFLSEAERRLLGEWLFGCDLCQVVCPFNTGLAPGAMGSEDFAAARGVGPQLQLALLLAMRHRLEFDRLFKGTALYRSGRPTLLRNAAVVAANTGAVACIPALLGAAAEDAAPVVRAHCLWALAQLGGKAAAETIRVRGALERGLQDDSPEVAAEAKQLLVSLETLG